jgi:hypothetical protein
MNQEITFEEFILLWKDFMPASLFHDIVKFHVLDFLETISLNHGYRTHFHNSDYEYFVQFTKQFHFKNEKEILKEVQSFLTKTSSVFTVLKTLENKSNQFN